MSSSPQQQAYGQPGQQVMMQQPGHTTTIIHQAPVVRPSSYLALAIFVTICCNLVFGKCNSPECLWHHFLSEVHYGRIIGPTVVYIYYVIYCKNAATMSWVRILTCTHTYVIPSFSLEINWVIIGFPTLCNILHSDEHSLMNYIKTNICINGIYWCKHSIH